MTYKISVIIPVYNAERYLERSMKSVINQTIGFDNIELILVDDNSTDSSKRIIKNYSEKFNNIKPIFLKENTGGPSTPRNVGVESASTELIMFMDNDDEYMPDLCEILYNNMVKNDVDLVSCRNCRSTENGEIYFDEETVKFNDNNDRILLEGEDIIKFDDLVIWNKIFKKSIILNNNIKFPNSRNEDYYFCCKYFVYSKKILYLKEYVGYKWYNNENSLSKYYYYDQIDGLIEMYTRLCVELKDCGINPNLFFNNRIHTGTLFILCSPFLLNQPKEKIITIFEKYVNFEKELDSKEKRNFLFNTGKNLLMNGKYTLAISYLKILGKMHNSDKIRNIYNKIR